jgi:hypothetical protein
MDQKTIKEIVAAEMRKGVSLSDIQNLLMDEHGVKMTFLDLRMLASELEEILAAMAAEDARAAEEAAAKAADDGDDKETKKEEAAGTVVEVSKLARPGALAHGTVKFASGARAEWVFDQYGRLGLEKSDGQPTETDIKDFQKELQKVLSRM